MARQNFISLTIPETDPAEINVAISTLKSKLLPHMRTLDAQERHELPKMGDKTTAFVLKAYEYSRKNEALLPPFLDTDAFALDVNTVELLRNLSQDLAPIADALEDSLTLAGSDAYQGALVFYNSVKGAARVKAPNALSIYDDLSARFPGAPVKRKTEPQAVR